MAEKRKTKPEKIKNPGARELNLLLMWETVDTDFGATIRRVPGGYIYEYPTGNVFVSTDEFRNE